MILKNEHVIYLFYNHSSAINRSDCFFYITPGWMSMLGTKWDIYIYLYIYIIYVYMYMVTIYWIETFENGLWSFTDLSQIHHKYV